MFERDLPQTKSYRRRCGAPEFVGRDQQRRLHAAEGPAMRWEDGWKIYSWHGIAVPENWIMQPDQISRDDFMAETNAERRRALVEIIGSDRLASLLDLVEVSRERRHPELAEDVLLRTSEPDPVAGKVIQFVRVMCPTTGRVYHLCVPPTIRSASEAVAWTFGKSAEEYRPAVEA